MCEAEKKSIFGGRHESELTPHKKFPRVSDWNNVALTTSQSPEDPPQNATANADRRPARNRGGAPRGNRNALKSGLHTFTAGKWPRGASYVARLVRAFRRKLEDEVRRQHGKLTWESAAWIDAACEAEARYLLLWRWLRLRYESLDTREFLSIMDRKGRAIGQRHKAVVMLLDPRRDRKLGRR
jgi:hypothetical protein